MTDFRAEGEKLHAEQPELMLAEVWWHARHRSEDQGELTAFVEGYQAARARRDAFLAEQKDNALIPINGVHITATEYPKGFQVARYDAEGFTSHSRWFEAVDKAQAYADGLKQ